MYKMRNWNYDKLFAKGNVIGLRNVKENRIFVHEVFSQEDFDNDVTDKLKEVRWDEYKNGNLTFKGCNYDFEIAYVIRLDEHGNVIERIFDRERDMPSNPMPELKNGMFGKALWYEDGEFKVGDGFLKLGRFVVCGKKAVYQAGGFDCIESLEDNYNFDDSDCPVIVELYDDIVDCFDAYVSDCTIWRNPRYQAWLDAKGVE